MRSLPFHALVESPQHPPVNRRMLEKQRESSPTHPNSAPTTSTQHQASVLGLSHCSFSIPKSPKPFLEPTPKLSSRQWKKACGALQETSKHIRRAHGLGMSSGKHWRQADSKITGSSSHHLSTQTCRVQLAWPRPTVSTEELLFNGF